jgi:hypothetical protein
MHDFRTQLAIDKSIVTIRKGAEDMDRNSENLMMFAKMAIAQGCSPGLNKSVFIAGITLRADAIRKVGESAAQAFARAITADEIGKTLYRASKVAPGPEIEPDGTSDYPASTAKAPPWVGLGPAHAKMQTLADDHLKANPRKSKEGAFAHVYTHPDNIALREACKQEHFAAINKAAA